jgi:hypothetical protein
MTTDAIARRTNVPEEMVIHAISELMKSDHRSRSKEEDGRRLAPIDSHREWGWQIVNYGHYRNIKDEEARRAYFRDKKREQREKSTSVHSGQESPQKSKVVKDSPMRSNNVTQGEGEGEVEGKATKQKPSRSKRERPPSKTALVASRHAEFKAAILKYWQSKNPDVEMPWDGSEGKQLAMWMASSPNVTVEQFTVFLRNRFKSEVVHSERPSRWIGSITSYAAGPLNKFKQPMEAANGNGRQADPERDARLKAIADQATARFERNSPEPR